MRNIKHPRKRVVVLQYKGKGKKAIFTYNTCAELAVENNKDKIGVSLNALWNALSKNDGVFENEKCKIYYRQVENKDNIEWK